MLAVHDLSEMIEIVVRQDWEGLAKQLEAISGRVEFRGFPKAAEKIAYLAELVRKDLIEDESYVILSGQGDKPL